MKGGTAMGIFFLVLILGLIVVVILLFTQKNVDVLSTIVILGSTGLLTWAAGSMYKPCFTQIVFSETGITSRTLFRREKLETENLRGIWHFKLTDPEKMEPYTPGRKVPKGSVLLFGDIAAFKGAKFLRMNGAPVLLDSFSRDYTTILYRKKGLDEILNYYSGKVEENKRYNRRVSESLSE